MCVEQDAKMFKSKSLGRKSFKVKSSSALKKHYVVISLQLAFSLQHGQTFVPRMVDVSLFR